VRTGSLTVYRFAQIAICTSKILNFGQKYLKIIKKLKKIKNFLNNNRNYY